MLNLVFNVYSVLIGSLMTMMQVIFTLLLFFLMKKFQISSQRIAIFGFALLCIVLICNVIQQEDIAGDIAQYVWITFAIAFISQIVTFIRNESN